MDIKMNEAQREAICHGEGPARVLAGPGSGKTFVIVQRIMHLIRELKAEPASILVITFTKAAAVEMQKRFNKVMNNEPCPVQFGTFHALFYYILQSSDSNFSKKIISESDKISVIKRIKKDFLKQFPDICYPMEEELVKQIGKFKNTGEYFDATDSMNTVLEECHFRWIYNEYNRIISQENQLDFDDMAGRCLLLFQRNPAQLRLWQNRFKYILIDEFQDINTPQYDVVRILAGDSRNIFVVGDDDQSIYGFRGADPLIMKRFVQDYPESKCIFLNVNYRSKKEIVDVAGKCIGVNKNRIAKEFICAKEGCSVDNTIKHDGQAAGLRVAQLPVSLKSFVNKETEAEYVENRLIRWKEAGYIYEDAAIICRTNYGLEEYALILEKAGIPFQRREKRKSIFEHPIMKDIEAYIRLAAGEKSRNLLLQIINRPARFIGREYFNKENMGLDDLKRACINEYTKADKIARLEKDCNRLVKMHPYPAVNYIRKAIGYDEYLKELAGDNKEQLKMFTETIDFIQNHAKEYDSLQEWLRAVERHRSDYTGTNDIVKKGVNLITMHGAKGLEFALVILPDVNEGVIPGGKTLTEEAVEEERRIFYVAMTRAKDYLDIYYLNSNGDRKKLPSRFLKPILGKQFDN